MKYRSYGHALSRLKTVTFEDPVGFGTNMFWPNEQLEPILVFAQIPSLRNIVVRSFRTPPVRIEVVKTESLEDYFEGFFDNAENEDDAASLPFFGLKTLDAIEHRTAPSTDLMDRYWATSNVESLTLHSCDPDERTFIPLLRTIISLRSSEFSRLPGDKRNGAFDNLLTALIEHAGHSLENLTLRTHVIKNLPDVDIRLGTSPTTPPPCNAVPFQLWGDIPNLQGLTQLTKLTLDAEYLIDDNHRPVQLLHLLPASLEILQLGRIDEITAELKRVKQDLACNLLQDLPSLSVPIFDSTDPEYAAYVDDKHLHDCPNSSTNNETFTSLAELLVRYPGQVRAILDRLDEIQDDSLAWLDKLFACAEDVSKLLPKLGEVLVETRDEKVVMGLGERFVGTGWCAGG